MWVFVNIYKSFLTAVVLGEEYSRKKKMFTKLISSQDQDQPNVRPYDLDSLGTWLLRGSSQDSQLPQGKQTGPPIK